MAKFDYVCIDVETTGLNHVNDEIVEITAVEFNLSGATGKIITQLCKPMLGMIPPEITKINNITWEMVKDKPYYLKDGVQTDIAKFIGRRIAVGHNIIGFDIKFMKINVRKMEDTLLMCRKRWRGGNKLKTACLKIGIKWDDKQAHRSEYDVLKDIELFVKLKELDEKDKEKVEVAPLFAQMENRNVEKSPGKIGIIPTENDKNIFATQAYSFSRVSLFNQCRFKWYMTYIKKVKQPDVSYLVTGKVCHRVAEWAGEWCYRELISNKLVAYARIKNLELFPELSKDVADDFGIQQDKVTFHDVGKYLYKYQAKIGDWFKGLDGLASLIFELDKIVPEDQYENPSMPDLQSYNEIVNKAMASAQCTDPDIIRDIRYIMNRFYENKDFSLVPGDVILTEKRLAFDKNWKLLKDFFSNKAFFRGVIDVLGYLKDCVVITDYKTSRKMMTVEQLREDIQMKLYVLLVYYFMPKESYNRIIVRIEFIRFSKSIEYEITDVKAVADEAVAWINDSIQLIEAEMLKTEGDAFEPQRNEFCHACFLGEEGQCPLFDKRFINNINDVERFVVTDIEDCQTAWKRVEANKAENKRLTNQCKVFINGCTDAVKIDTHATLDYYVKEHREFYSLKTMQMLLRKGIAVEDLVKYVTISQDSLKKLLERKKVELSQEEIDSISKIKTKSKFEAFTEKEAKNSGYINA